MGLSFDSGPGAASARSRHRLPCGGRLPSIHRPGLRGRGGAGRALRPTRPEPDRLRELQAGQPGERVGHQRRRRRRPEPAGVRDRHQRQPRRDRPLQDRHPLFGVSPRHLPDGLLQRRRRPQGGHRHALGEPAADAARLHRRPDDDGADRLRQLGGVRLLGGPGRRSVGHLLRQARPRRRRGLRRQPHLLHRP